MSLFQLAVPVSIILLLLTSLVAIINLVRDRPQSSAVILLAVLGVPLILYLFVQTTLSGIDFNANQNFINRFGIYHLIYALAAVALTAYLILNRHRIRQNARPYYWFFFITLLAQQAALYTWFYLFINFDLAQALPLHLSRMTSLYILIFFIFKHEFWSQLAFFWGIFAIGTFLWPTDINWLNHVLGWTFLISHVITLTFPILIHLGEAWLPKKSYLHISYAVFLVYLPIIIWVNRLTGGNYFYLVDRPFLNHLPNWAYLIVVLVGTYLVFWAGYYLYMWGFNRIRKLDREG